MMGRLVDSCMQVRMLCVKGLGNIADTGMEMVSVCYVIWCISTVDAAQVNLQMAFCVNW